MPLDITKSQENASFTKGTMLLSPSSLGQYMVVVHQGTVCLVGYPEDSMRGSNMFLRLEVFDDKPILGELSLCQRKPFFPYIFAESNGTLSVVPIPGRDLLLRKNPTFALKVLTQMNNRLHSVRMKYRDLYGFYKLLMGLNQRFLLHCSLEPNSLKPLPLQYNRMRQLSQVAKRANMPIEAGKAFTAKIEHLKGLDALPPLNFVPLFFIEDLFSKNDNEVAELLTQKKGLFDQVYEVLGMELQAVLKAMNELGGVLYKELLGLTEGDQSLLKVVGSFPMNTSIDWTEAVGRSLDAYKTQLLQSFSNHSPFLERLFDLDSLREGVEEAFEHILNPPTGASTHKNAIPADVYDFFEGIEGVPSELIRKTKTTLKEVSPIKNLHDASDKERKAVRQLNQHYLELYSLATQHCIESGKQLDEHPIECTLFLQYSLLNGGIVSESNSDFIRKSAPFKPFFGEGAMSVLPLHTWLNMLHKSEEEPSNTALGVSFQKYMEEQQRRMPKKKRMLQEDMSDEERKRIPIKYELDNMALSAMKLCSESPLKALFPLTKLNEPKTIANFLVRKDYVLNAFEEVRKKDFSVFYRETLFRVAKNVNEIVRMEVFPYLIILPTIGDKVVFWQDLSGTNKRTKARFAIPMVFMGDIRKSIYKVLAEFRWELCRSIKGHLWSNAVEGGITGAFYDYVMTYKRNTKLTSEAKEKIRKLLTNNRKDYKRMFLTYYNTWVEYESKGIMKFDSVARDFFFRHVPFSRKVRSLLEKLPAYERLIHRHNHQTRNILIGMESKYRKFRDENNNLPIELQKNMDYYSL